MKYGNDRAKFLRWQIKEKKWIWKLKNDLIIQEKILFSIPTKSGVELKTWKLLILNMITNLD